MMGVVVVAEHEVIRSGLTNMVAGVPEVSAWRGMSAIDDTVGQVGDGIDTDMLIMTLAVREAVGDDVAVFIGLPTMVIMPNDDPAVLECGAGMKADGYVMLNDLTAVTLRSALLALSEDRLQLPPAMATHLLALAREDVRPLSYAHNHISPRERDVLDGVLAGWSNKEIAADLGLSIHGVKRHVSNILGKYGSPSRAHLVSMLLRTTGVSPAQNTQ